MQTAANPPAPTPEFDALTPVTGESPMDALTRVGDGIVAEVGGSETKDSRKNKKLPKQLAALIGLRAQGFDNHEIATKLNLGKKDKEGNFRPDTRKLKGLIAKARREYGWSDLNDKLVNVAVPLAVESTIAHLEYEGSAAGVVQGMSTVTRATLAGVGVFKSHAAAKIETKSESTNIFRVEISLPQLPPGNQALTLAEGSVMATPRRALPSVVDVLIPAASSVLDGEVVGVKS